MSPRITVALSVHNGDKYLRETLESLIVQTETDWECMAIDDGSTDTTGKILDEYAAKDKRFRVFHHTINLGLTVSLNEAIRNARGKYIARQDADDFSTPDRFEKQADFLDHNPEVALVGSYYEVMDLDGTPLSVSRPPHDTDKLRERLERTNPLAHGSLMFKADEINEIGGYRTEFKMAQDYDLILRCLADWDVAVVPHMLYRLRLVPEGGSLKKLELQNFYADTARRLYQLRQDPAAQRELLSDVWEREPKQVSTIETATQRYFYVRALHLVKAGRVSEARAELSKCTESAVRCQASKLKAFSYLPAFLRSLFISN